jgi:hypothetical protein
MTFRHARATLGTTTKRRAAFAAVLGAATLGLAAPAAHSASIVFVEGSLSTAGAFGPTHSITEVSARLLSSSVTGNACVRSAYKVAGGEFWDSEIKCVATSDGVVSKPYCGCTLREGWAGTSWGASVIRGREDY